MSIKIHTPTFSIARPSKIDQNWDFRVENIPSGNPGPAFGIFVAAFFAFVSCLGISKDLFASFLANSFFLLFRFGLGAEPGS
jgi:hypothetical protein